MGAMAHLLHIGPGEADRLTWPDWAGLAHWCDGYLAERQRAAG